MSRHCLRSDRRGLTLIELVLTLTILALAGTLVSGALVTGLRTWQSGLRSGREEQIARIVLERIATQLRAAVLAPAKKDGAETVAFDAGEDHVRFVTLAAGGAVPAQVSFHLQEGQGAAHLVYREYPWPDKEFFAPGRPRREETVPEVTGFSVKVVKRTEATGPAGEPAAPSTTEWSTLDQQLPASVSVTITVALPGEPEPRQYAVTVPVLARKEPK